jgi:hypothetical protein
MNDADGSDDASRLDDITSTDLNLVGDLALPDDMLGDNSPPLSLARTEALRVSVTLPLCDVLDFSVRFGCKYRHYNYFFITNGLDVAFMP